MRFDEGHIEQWRPAPPPMDGSRYLVSDLGRAAIKLRGSIVKGGHRRFTLMLDRKTYYRTQHGLLQLVRPAPGEWAEVPGFPWYMINGAGEVARYLSISDNGKGYKYISLLNLKVGAHRVVCHAFHGPPPFPDADAAHGDGDKSNNHACNLRWATRKENMADALEHGVLGRRRKLSKDQARDIRRRYAAGESRKGLAQEYRVHEQTIYRIGTGRRQPSA